MTEYIIGSVVLGFVLSILWSFIRWARKTHQETQYVQYVFSIKQTVKLGQACEIRMESESRPDLDIRVERFIMNALSPGMFIVKELRFNDVNVLAGGTCDAYMFSPQSMGSQFRYLPAIRKGQPVELIGSYTGLKPYSPELGFLSLDDVQAELPGIERTFVFVCSIMGGCNETITFSNWVKLKRALVSRWWRIKHRLPWYKDEDDEEDEETDSYVYDKPCSVCNAPADDVNGYVPCQKCGVPLCEKCVHWAPPEPHGLCPKHNEGSVT